jgi:hypothetical protein
VRITPNLKRLYAAYPRSVLDRRIWDAYGIYAWPTQLIFDRTGRLRTTIVGDSQDERVTAAVHALI